jgi:heme/copper-type cytochrome/quinol oxidase subunit 2
LYGLYYLDVGGERVSKGLVVVVAKQWYWVFNVLSSEVCDVLDFGGFSQLFQFRSYYDFLLSDGFRYLEVDASLFILVGQVFRFLFSSTDVVHRYCVPELAIKMDCVPGRYNQGFLFLHVPGKYYGRCVEICGVGHSMMPVCVEGLV